MGCTKFFPVDITYKFLNIKGPTVQKDATQKQLGPCEPLLILWITNKKQKNTDFWGVFSFNWIKKLH